MKQNNNFNMDDVIFHGIKNQNIMHINWGFTEACNYNCSYCFSKGGAYKKLKNHVYDNLGDVIKIADQLLSLNIDSYFFNITGGGEPTLHPHLIDLLLHISKSNKTVYTSITTNGSKTPDFFETIFKIPNIHFYLKHSIHLEFFSLEHTKKIIQKCNEYNIPISLLFMFNPDRREQCKTLIANLIEFRGKNLFELRIDELRGGKHFTEMDPRYTKDDLQWAEGSRKNFKKVSEKKPSGYDSYWSHELFEAPQHILKDGSIKILPHYKAFSTGKKNFKEFNCCAGINHIRVFEGGDYQAAVCGPSKKVGNLINGKIDLLELTKPINCTADNCGCNGNDLIPKFRSKNDANNFVNEYLKQNLQEVLLGMQNKSSAKLDSLLEAIAWRIPIRRLRDSFRKKFNL